MKTYRHGLTINTIVVDFKYSKEGLKPDLKLACIADEDGKEWEILQVIFEMVIFEESRIKAMQKVHHPSSTFPAARRAIMSVAAREQYKRPRSQSDYPDMSEFPVWTLRRSFHQKTMSRI